MMIRLNYFINLLNLLLIFIYFIFINIELVKKEFAFLLISLILINLSIKLYNWNIYKEKNLHITFNNIFFNDRFIRLSIFIFSIVTPIYMIVQKDSLAIDLFIEKLSFLLVFIFSFVGFYLEFFILERKSNK